MDLDANISNAESGSRSLRPRSSIGLPKIEKKKKRKSLINLSFDCSEEVNVEDIYLNANKNISPFKPSSLETIYESPKGRNQHCMGAVKLKRRCRFDPFYNPTKCKLKMRKTKSKNLKRLGVKVPTGLNITLEQVKKCLDDISEDENEENSQPLQLKESPINDFGFKNNELNLNIHENLELKNDIHSLSSCFLEMNVDKEQAPQTLNGIISEMSMDQYKKPEKDFKKIMEDELLFDNLDTSPGKITIDKSKKNRRRSGRVRPLSARQISEMSMLDIDVPEENSDIPINPNLISNKEPSLLIPFCDPVQKQIQEISNVILIQSNKPNPSINSDIHPCNPTPQLQFSTNNAYGESSLIPQDSLSPKEPILRTTGKPKKRGRPLKARRVSGITRSIYKTILNTPSPEISSPEICSNTSFVPKLSPTTLFQQMNLDSPKAVVCRNERNRGRRKSARLSIGKSLSIRGSLWNENSGMEDLGVSELSELPKKMILPNPSPPSNTLIQPLSTQHESVFHNTLQTSSDILNKAEISPASPEPQAPTSMDLTSDNSPIISGIIDCKARMTKNNNFIVKKGIKIKLQHFKL